ncbi:MAG: TIM barrel protein [Candidatus Bathyarchaeia archaeon]|nr:TIM barrel protein [Candidatus Bathyarchaeota archaeon A05DMB-4]MDH7595089.1 TIM barrel protein [Candidatus Bathyarchaeota archaeon]
MGNHPRFGPAGTPYAFKLLKKPIAELPHFLCAEGLDALEYQASRWGQTTQMKRENAEKLGQNARANDVWLGMHGSYFINLIGNKTVAEASKRRLLACATAAHWMKAHCVVFHPGFYMRRSPREALDALIKVMNQVVEIMQSRGVKVKLAPETTGRISQLGSLDEVLTICERVEQTELVIDWAHIYARTHGSLRTSSDFAKIIDMIETRLGTDAAKNLHCHFTRMEFSKKGEVRHHVLDEITYGPEFRDFARVIVEFGLTPVVICESPLLDVDAKKMQNILYREMEKGKR